MRWIPAAVALAALLVVPAAVPGPAACGPSLGRVAYLRGAALHVLQLGSCRDRVLVRRAAAPVRWSPDGHFLAYGDGLVVAARGGTPLHLLGHPTPAWAWRPGSTMLVGITRGGGVLVGGPGRQPRRIFPDGWGAQNLLFDASGRALGVARWDRDRHLRQIWEVLWPAMTPQQVVGGAAPGDPPLVAALSRGGGWVFWWVGPNSASLAADGMRLVVKGAALGAIGPRIAAVLGYPEYLSWCGARLVVAAGGGRYATADKRLVVASPPPPAFGQSWRVNTLSHEPGLSWVSPACSPDGKLVAASAGPNRIEQRFGQERRAVWILGLDGAGRRVTSPGAATDELPRWSRDGRWVLFVRTRGGAGSLFLVRSAGGRVIGPLATISAGQNYYGHYGFAATSDWFRG